MRIMCGRGQLLWSDAAVPDIFCTGTWYHILYHTVYTTRYYIYTYQSHYDGSPLVFFLLHCITYQVTYFIASYTVSTK